LKIEVRLLRNFAIQRESIGMQSSIEQHLELRLTRMTWVH
jgi:hypothetical protein